MVRCCMQDVRVQTLRGGSNNPTSRCPEARSIEICVKLKEVRTLVPEEGGGLYRVRWTPLALGYTGFKVHKDGALLITPAIKIHE